MTETVDVKLTVPIKCSTIHNFIKMCSDFIGMCGKYIKKIWDVCFILLVGIVMIFFEVLLIFSIGVIINYPIISSFEQKIIWCIFGCLFIGLLVNYIIAVAHDLFNVNISIDCIRNGG